MERVSLSLAKRYEKVRSFSELRQHAMWFTKGLKGARTLRNSLMRAENIDQILGLYSRIS